MPRAARRATGAGPGTHERIYAAVRRIPRGRVTTYGAVAKLAGLGGQARLVGYALSALRGETSVPWHRVINAQGKLSLERSGSSSGTTQRLRLVREGVSVDAAGRVSLVRFGWKVKWKVKDARAGVRATHREDAAPSHFADDTRGRRGSASTAKRKLDNVLDAR
jgi:methylated-DNA-protein-cysteine methyltransferase-like protein